MISVDEHERKQKQKAAATPVPKPPSFSAEETMAEAARAIFTDQLAIISRYEPAVRHNAGQKKELVKLAKSFNVVWTTFDAPSWRSNLARALSAR